MPSKESRQHIRRQFVGYLPLVQCWWTPSTVEWGRSGCLPGLNYGRGRYTAALNHSLVNDSGWIYRKYRGCNNSCIIAEFVTMQYQKNVKHPSCNFEANYVIYHTISHLLFLIDTLLPPHQMYDGFSVTLIFIVIYVICKTWIVLS